MRFISDKDRGINTDDRSKLVRKFVQMFEEKKIKQIEKMWWSSRYLPELYVEARKQSYWLNIVRIPSPIKLKGGCKIKLLRFGELIESGPIEYAVDHYDQVLANLLKNKDGSGKRYVFDDQE